MGMTVALSNTLALRSSHIILAVKTIKVSISFPCLFANPFDILGHQVPMQSSCDTLLDKVEVEGHVYTLLAGIFKDEEPA
jgi:hypothetical protein